MQDSRHQPSKKTTQVYFATYVKSGVQSLLFMIKHMRCGRQALGVGCA